MSNLKEVPTKELVKELRNKPETPNSLQNDTKESDIKNRISLCKGGDRKPWRIRVKNTILIINRDKGTKINVLNRSGDYTLLIRVANLRVFEDPSPYIVAWNFTENNNGICSWDQGHYFKDYNSALNFINEVNKVE